MGSPTVTKPADEKLFLLCAWNRPKGHGEDSTTMAVETSLLVLGWTRAKDEDEKRANLVVIVPRIKDKPLSLDDLAVYSLGLGGEKRKKVLYLHAAAHVSFHEGKVNSWLFWASRGSCPFQELTTWLESEVASKDSGTPKEFDLDAAKDEIEALKKKLPEQPKNGAKDTFNLSRTGEECIKADTRAEFFFGLCRISSAYNRIEHDINARESSELDRDFGEIVKDHARKRMVDLCADLRSAIAARYTIGTASSNIRDIILLIDDHPERSKLAEQIDAHISHYLNGFKLWIWNPNAPSDLPEELRKDLLERSDVEQYSSLAVNSDGLLKHPVRTQAVKASDKNKSSKELVYICQDDSACLNSSGKFQEKFFPTLKEVLAGTHTVVVDILFEDAAGRDVEAGFGIISGIQRICRDHQKEIQKKFKEIQERRKENRSGGENPHNDDLKWRPPEAIAISRASDLNKVHAVFRRGGAGYVLKERLLSLPAAIARGHKPTIDAFRRVHRNFRQLYNLPHETIGLLRSTTIPRLPFHRCLFDEVKNPQCKKWQEKQDRKAKLGKAQPIAQLIAALPKADLHVHPGSCMGPEFLVIASLVMLLRHDLKTKKAFSHFKDSILRLSCFWRGEEPLWLTTSLVVDKRRNIKARTFWSGGVEEAEDVEKGSPIQVEVVANWTCCHLIKQIDAGEKNRKSGHDIDIENYYTELRSTLHRGLNLPDYMDAKNLKKGLKNKQATALFLFALSHSHSGLNDKTILENKDDILRLFILWLMAADGATVKLHDGNKYLVKDIKLNQWFREGDIEETDWNCIHNYFYQKEQCYSTEYLRNCHWDIRPGKESLSFSVQAPGTETVEDYLSDCPCKTEQPLAWLLASGTRSTNLREYLEGCEYSGAEHLRHPFLIHLFAQQTVHNFVRHGVLYAELRAAISGYENESIKFSFADACACFCTAFGQAQEMVRDRYRQTKNNSGTWLWQESFALSDLFNPLKSELAKYRFPCKVSVILTGKRHKPSRMLVREAGAGAILFSRPLKPATNAREFVEEAISECRIVGFDLAGQEDEHPPHQFRGEYEQIAKMHIPVTVHAGENAPVEFVESAILDLRARRLGHGLALADNKKLMARARDDGICIELCPVSNFQTNAVFPPGKVGHGREYPLRKFLEEGLAVTINTDNPIISCTNMVKECFQASYAFGKPGLSLWELLRILRLGFAHAFLTLHERRALLELADQIVFDLFSDQEIVRLLHLLSIMPSEKT